MSASPISTEQIWRDLHADLFRFVRRRVSDESAADDLLQDVFLRIHDGIDGLDDSDRLRAWVFQIARNVVYDHYRAGGRIALNSELTSEVEPAAADAAMHPQGDENINAEVAGWLVNMVDDLPDAYRQAVRLAEFEGLPQKQVAEELGLSHSGAKSRIQRGRRMLKEALLRCCHLETDQRGNVLDFTRRSACPCCREGDCPT